MCYQLVVLDEEMSGPMDISNIACQRSTPGNPAEGLFIDFAMYMGLCESDALSSSFIDNYIPGTKILVFNCDSLTLSPDPGEWQAFDLDTPFWYNGEDNLIVEFEWSAGITEDECLYTWHWDTGTIRSISGAYGSSTGTMSSMVAMLKFTGDLSLTQMTYGSIKALFSPGEGDL